MVIFDVIPVVFVEASFDEKNAFFLFCKKAPFFFKVENLKRFIELGAINKTQNSTNKLVFFLCASAKIKWLNSYFKLHYDINGQKKLFFGLN